MFNTLASYLLGTSNQQPAAGVEERNVRLTSVLSEDDWVLVERDSEGNSEVESVGSTESLDGRDDLERRQVPPPHLLTRSSSTASLPCAGLEESWFVTPPPCFTSAGPVNMETSPLENLLIEHPSMSVYQHSHPALAARRHSSARAHSVDSGDLSADEHDAEAVEAAVPVRRVADEGYRQRIRELQQVPRRNVTNSLSKQEQQWFKSKQAQKVQIQKACQSLKRKYLERANKAREVNCRNRHPRRSERSQGARRSCANNNRKC